MDGSIEIQFIASIHHKHEVLYYSQQMGTLTTGRITLTRELTSRSWLVLQVRAERPAKSEVGRPAGMCIFDHHVSGLNYSG